jgi:hypothetical protein
VGETNVGLVGVTVPVAAVAGKNPIVTVVGVVLMTQQVPSDVALGRLVVYMP